MTERQKKRMEELCDSLGVGHSEGDKLRFRMGYRAAMSETAPLVEALKEIGDPTTGMKDRHVSLRDFELRAYAREALRAFQGDET